MQKPKPCHCSAYPFPHRPGGGACRSPSWICADCHSPCDGEWLESRVFGSGMRCLELVSECCHADVVAADDLRTITVPEPEPRRCRLHNCADHL